MPDIQALRKLLKERLVSRLRVLRISVDQFLDERTVTNRTDSDLLARLDDEIDDDLSEEKRLLAIQEMMKRQSLMTSILTNIANMRHESLKAIAANLKG